MPLLRLFFEKPRCGGFTKEMAANCWYNNENGVAS